MSVARPPGRPTDPPHPRPSSPRGERRTRDGGDVTTPLHVGGVTAAALIAAVGLAGDVGRHLQVAASLTEGFFASWHLVLYGGVTALVLWLGALAVTHGPAAMRSAFGPSVWGAILLMLAGLADFAWHGAFGVEIGLAALLSPPHLGLLVGLTVVFAGPLKALWQRPDADLNGWAATVVVVCVVGAVSVLMLFTGYLSLFSADVIVNGMRNPMVGTRSTPDQVIPGIATMLWSSLVLSVPWLALRLRWRLRPGMITAGLTLPAVGAFLSVPGLAEEAVWATVITAVVVDGLVTVVAAGTPTGTSMVLTAAALPLVLWSMTFLLLARNGALVWDEAQWMGTIVLSVIETTAIAGLLVLASQAPPTRLRPRPPAQRPAVPVDRDGPAPGTRGGSSPMHHDRPPPAPRAPTRAERPAPTPSGRRDPSPFRLDGPPPAPPGVRPPAERPPETPRRKPPPPEDPPRPRTGREL